MPIAAKLVAFGGFERRRAILKYNAMCYICAVEQESEP